MKTQITVPWPTECAAMKAKIQIGTRVRCPVKKAQSNQPERRDVTTKRANIKKRAPAQPVNQPKPDKCENKIGCSNADRLQQRGFCAKSR